MQAPAHIFREYDIRGVVGDDLATIQNELEEFLAGRGIAEVPW